MLAAESAPADALRRMHLADLYLACACAEGDARALAALEVKVWPAVDAVLARIGVAPARRQDLLQDLRAALFTASGTTPGRISQYRGRGELRRWLGAAAVREAYRVTARDRRETVSDTAVLGALAGAGGDPELAYLKELYRVEIEAAFHAALGTLERPERNLLRQHHVDGLTIDVVAHLHGVHRATAARRIAKARQRLTAKILEDLRDRLRVSESELASIIRLVRSQIDVGLDCHLQAG